MGKIKLLPYQQKVIDQTADYTNVGYYLDRHGTWEDIYWIRKDAHDRKQS